MTPHIERYAMALTARRKQGEELWAKLKQDILHQPELTRRYCACMRLCEWLQKKVRSSA